MLPNPRLELRSDAETGEGARSKGDSLDGVDCGDALSPQAEAAAADMAATAEAAAMELDEDDEELSVEPSFLPLSRKEDDIFSELGCCFAC